MINEKDTVGSIISKREVSSLELVAPEELSDDLKQAHIDAILSCATEGLKKFDTDFYIVILMKHEKKLGDIIRLYPIIRSTCPTPDYDQAVYKVIYKSHDIEYIWTIPDKMACLALLEHKNNISNEYKELLQHVIDFESGELYRRAKELNKELNAPDVIFEIKREE